MYALGGQAQLEGALLSWRCGVGFALILWGKHLFPPEIVTEPRGAHESPRPAIVAGAGEPAEDARSGSPGGRSSSG